MKNIIMLTDGQFTITEYNLNRLLERGIQLYIVGLGNSISSEKIAEYTAYENVEYYAAATAAQLEGIYENLAGRHQFNLSVLADNDSDGMPDDFEVSGMVCQNGTTHYSDPDNPDTDGDGLLDGYEISYEIDKAVHYNYGLKQDETTYNSVSFTMYSDPNDDDADYDGISDKHDVFPYINTYEVSVTDKSFEGFDAEITVDYRNFFEENTEYNKDLAVLGSIFADLAYVHEDKDNGVRRTTINPYKDLVKNTYTKGTDLGIEEVFTVFGLSDYEDYKLVEHYNDDDISEMMIGHKPVYYNGETKEIVVVSIRGTDGTIEEWSSNFDVGANTDEYYKAIGVDPDKKEDYWWENKSNHKGFDVTAYRLFLRLEAYIDENTNKDLPKAIYIVGHSRGAAIANILGTRIEDDTDHEPFVYTFASPATTTALDKIDDYDFIFNIVNEDDLVTYLPLSKWGFDRYGITYSASIVEDYEDTSNPFSDAKYTWEYMFEKEWDPTVLSTYSDDYNYNKNLEDTVRAMEELADCREELYIFSGDSDTYASYIVDNRDGGYDFLKYYATTYAETYWNEWLDELKDYNHRIARYCGDYYVNNSNTSIYVNVHQSPATFMMILADLTAEFYHDSEKGFYQVRDRRDDEIVGLTVAYKYQDAKNEFCYSGADSKFNNFLSLGGMGHAHMVGTYYFLANDYKDKLEN